MIIIVLGQRDLGVRGNALHRVAVCAHDVGYQNEVCVLSKELRDLSGGVLALRDFAVCHVAVFYLFMLADGVGGFVGVFRACVSCCWCV